MQTHEGSSNNDPDLKPSNSLSKPSHSLFSPSTTNFLQVETSDGFCNNAVWYSQRHNMIIVCPQDENTMLFYNATTLLPLEERETLELDSLIMQMSFHSEIDTYILGCSDGWIYMYNALNHELKRLRKCENLTLKATFLSWPFYAFSVYGSNKISIGNIMNNNVRNFDSPKSDAWDLHYLPKSNLLFSSVSKGYVRIYSTSKLPDLLFIGRFQGERKEKGIVNIRSFVVNGKEYLTTEGEDKEIKIWHVFKGRMRLVKVIWTKEKIIDFVYLENYSMIAVVNGLNEIEFLGFPSGRLEKTFKLEKDDGECMFLMKNKNMLGVTSCSNGVVEFVQLHPKENG